MWLLAGSAQVSHRASFRALKPLATVGPIWVGMWPLDRGAAPRGMPTFTRVDADASVVGWGEIRLGARYYG